MERLVINAGDKSAVLTYDISALGREDLFLQLHLLLLATVHLLLDRPNLRNELS